MKELIESGKVAVITKEKSFLLPFGSSSKTTIEVKGFDSIKDEVTEHFKKGLFDEQISKSLGDKLDQLAQQKKEISDLKSEVHRLKSRNLWERMYNK